MVLLLALLFVMQTVCCSTTNIIISFPWIAPLAEYLKDEKCELYILGLTSDKLEAISQAEAVSFFVLDKTPINYKTRTCKSLIYEVDGIDNADVDQHANGFQKKYIIQPKFGYDTDKRGSDFGVPSVLFRTGTDGNTQVLTSCHKHKDLKYRDLYKPGGGLTFEGHHICSNYLRGSTLDVSASGIYPYTYSSKTGTTMAGTDITLLKIIARKLQFSFHITNEKGTPGIKINNTWTGVVGKILLGKAQIGIGGMTMILRGDANEVVDYTSYVDEQNFYLFTPIPKIISSYMNFVTPFTGDAWMAILISLFLSTITLMILGNLMVKFSWDNLLVCFRLQMMQPGTKIKTQLTSPWILIGFWSITALFINEIYLCNYKAYLMRSHYEKNVDSLEDAIDQNKELYFPRQSYIPSLLQFSPMEARKNLFRTSNAKNLYYSLVNERIPKKVLDDMIRNGRMQLYPKAVILSYFADFEKMYGYVPFRVGNRLIFPFYYGFLLPKRVLWSSDINNVILHLVQGGIPQFLETRLIKDQYLKEVPEDLKPRQFDLDHMLGCVLVLVGGFGIGSVIFIAEMLIKFTVLDFVEPGGAMYNVAALNHA